MDDNIKMVFIGVIGLILAIILFNIFKEDSCEIFGNETFECVKTVIVSKNDSYNLTAEDIKILDSKILCDNVSWVFYSHSNYEKTFNFDFEMSNYILEVCKDEV